MFWRNSSSNYSVIKVISDSQIKVYGDSFVKWIFLHHSFSMSWIYPLSLFFSFFFFWCLLCFLCQRYCTGQNRTVSCGHIQGAHNIILVRHCIMTIIGSQFIVMCFIQASNTVKSGFWLCYLFSVLGHTSTKMSWNTPAKFWGFYCWFSNTKHITYEWLSHMLSKGV